MATSDPRFFASSTGEATTNKEDIFFAGVFLIFGLFARNSFSEMDANENWLLEEDVAFDDEGDDRADVAAAAAKQAAATAAEEEEERRNPAAFFPEAD